MTRQSNLRPAAHAFDPSHPVLPKSYLFTSESVSEGHPDKLADLISDTVLDAFLARDPRARVACETFLTGDLVMVGGEVGSNLPDLADSLIAQVPELVRDVLREVGYRGDFPGIDPERCEIRLALQAQSADIYQGVERSDGTQGAGDQGLMFGHACDETPALMPLPITLAHQLTQRQAALRHSQELPWLRPDAKAQVTVRYRQGRPACVEKVVVSTQHASGVSQARIRDGVIGGIIEPVIPPHLRSPDIQYLINPTGRFEVGGPLGDAGLTGRKIIVDTYGGSCPHGGGAFSGKDPSKVDRSAAYAARQVAKSLVAAGLARRCTVQLAYAIGVAEPVSVHVDTHGSGIVADTELEAAVQSAFDLTPAGLIESLDLRRPIYRLTTNYGHFGRERPEFTWESVSKADVLAARLAS